MLKRFDADAPRIETPHATVDVDDELSERRDGVALCQDRGAIRQRPACVDTTSERKRMVNPRKSYPVDPALIQIFDRTGRANTGHALETVVMLELERRGMDVAYVRTPEGHEVDFIARHPGGGEQLIQVVADATGGATAEREMRALAEAAPLYPRATRLLLTLTRDGIPREVPDGVVAMPAYEWLLGSDEE